MEKKKYITPECEVIELETLPMMLVASNRTEVEDGGGTDMGANRHRGEWGNLWSDQGKW